MLQKCEFWHADMLYLNIVYEFCNSKYLSYLKNALLSSEFDFLLEYLLGVFAK